MIFLLNLEVGYLHPPVGLNLFITSVKFQRPITEVMWATIPFLRHDDRRAARRSRTCPALTVVPEPERTGRVQDLAAMVHTAAEELTVVRDVTLVDAAGTPLQRSRRQADRRAPRGLRQDHRRDRQGRLPEAVLRRQGLQGRRDRARTRRSPRGSSRTSTASFDNAKAIILVTEVPLVTSRRHAGQGQGRPADRQEARRVRERDGRTGYLPRAVHQRVELQDQPARDDGDVDALHRQRQGRATWVDSNASE